MSETEKPSQEKEEHSKIEEIKENNENISLLISDSFTARLRPRSSGYHLFTSIQEVPPIGTISEFKGLLGWHNSYLPTHYMNEHMYDLLS